MKFWVALRQPSSLINISPRKPKPPPVIGVNDLLLGILLDDSLRLGVDATADQLRLGT